MGCFVERKRRNNNCHKGSWTSATREKKWWCRSLFFSITCSPSLHYKKSQLLIVKWLTYAHARQRWIQQFELYFYSSQRCVPSLTKVKAWFWLSFVDCFIFWGSESWKICFFECHLDLTLVVTFYNPCKTRRFVIANRIARNVFGDRFPKSKALCSKKDMRWLKSRNFHL